MRCDVSWLLPPHCVEALRFGPPAEALMHILPMAEAHRQVAPRDAGAITIQHRLDEPPVVRACHNVAAARAGIP